MLTWSPWAVHATSGSYAVTQEVADHVVAPNERVRAEVQRTGLCAVHPRFCQYRGLYRQVGVPFLVLSLFALPCWLLFRLYRVRKLRHPLSIRREILLLTFIVYLVGLVTLTLTPNGSSRLRAVGTGGIELRPDLATLTCARTLLPTVPNARTFCVQNAAGNVLLFFPLGIFVPMAWRELRFRRGMSIAIGLSIGIEVAQYLSSAWGSYRSADVNDVLLNGLGACLGLAFMSLLRWLRPSRLTTPRGSSGRTDG